MAGIITSAPPLVQQPPGNNSSNPAGLPGVTYTAAVPILPQTWTGVQTFEPGTIVLDGSGGPSEVLRQSTVNGAVTVGQLSFADISGSIGPVQIPPPTPTTLGGVFSIAAVSHQFLTQIGTDGTVIAAQPAFTDVSGSVAASQMPALTGDITTTAGAVATTLATVNTNVGTFGSATAVPQITTNGKGLITAVATVTITPAIGSVTGLGTGVATALGVNPGAAGSVVVNGGPGGTPSAVVLTNATGTASGLTAGHVTTNANLTGDVTSVGNATTLATGNAGNLNSGTLLAARMPALTGDVTTAAGAVATTIAANAVTNAKMATMNAWTFKANFTSGSAVPTDVTIDGTTLKAAPSASDELWIWDVSGSAIKKTTVSALSSAGSVASLGGLTGAIGLGPGITVNGSNIQLDPAFIGEIRQVAFNRIPANYLSASGGTKSRTTFAQLYGALVVSSTVTISNASPGVVTWTGNQLQNNDPILLTTTGSLPTGLAAATKYYVKGLSGNNFNLSATPGGTAINTSSAGSGVQTAINAPWEGTVVGDGSTTFTIPDLNGRFLRGIDNGDGTDVNRSFGTNQTDAFQGHFHTASVNGNPSLWQNNALNGGTGSANGPNAISPLVLTVSAAITDGTNGTPRTAAETRPVNQTVLYVIRYQ